MNATNPDDPWADVVDEAHDRYLHPDDYDDDEEYPR